MRSTENGYSVSCAGAVQRVALSCRGQWGTGKPSRSGNSLWGRIGGRTSIEIQPRRAIQLRPVLQHRESSTTLSQVSAHPLQSAALRRTLCTSARKSTRGAPFTPARAILALSSSEATKARAVSRFSHSNRSVTSLTFPALRKTRQLRSPCSCRQSRLESKTAFQAM